ncbi:substrate-binding periplasmic protein [Gulosibacter molinativorax]|uniref:Amino acid ABC transporter substrate-binding protein n=1 Tax=Gulosibacter molinativorax TaxID=256821 RepID=A0ABT7C7H6_9MICO|nr:transporter substrate-binding domain-containing protein [Gulosibacter molinativorax]MDJ1371163.1 amino acid ABC transporter substrate-binding protein [Gulosibacter molinativorax]QUY62979.1 Putative amino acid ABC transporter, periplasmic amino acid-binding protein [Gulosibacter molinativorax]
MNKKSIIAIALGSLLTFSMSACSSGSGGGSGAEAGCEPANEFSTVTDGTLTIAMYDLPPFAQSSGTEATGVDGDILTLFAEENCLTVTPSSMATASVIPTVEAGRADVAASAWYRTEARAEIINYTEPVYTDQMGIISSTGITTVGELEGHVVGTVDGYLFVEDLRTMLGDNLRVYPSTLNMYQDLEAGRIDVGIDSYGSGVYNNADDKFTVVVSDQDERVQASMEAAQISFPVPKSNEEILTALNTFLDEIRADGRLEQILIDNGLDASAADTGDPRLI